jgi:IclR family acetate operon transcriptional repressor
MSNDSLEPADAATDNGNAGALSKALDVLELVMSSPYPPSAAAITDTLNLPRPTTNRIISHLVKLDFLKRDVRQRQLIEGDRLLKLALEVVARATQRGPRHDILRELSDRIGETCNVGVITGGRVRYVDRVEARWPLSLRLEPGSEIPMHCTALGKLLLAYLPPVHREKCLMTSELTGYTEHTLTDADTLRIALDDIAKEGVSLDDEEYLSGVVGMAVPIPNGDAPPIMGLAIAAPRARASITALRDHLPLLREFAQRMTFCY